MKNPEMTIEYAEEHIRTYKIQLYSFTTEGIR